MSELDEIDIKRIVLSNIKLLFVMPLLVALAVFIMVNMLPRTYVSVSYIDVLGDVKYADAIMRSPLVLDSAPIKSFLRKDLSETEKKKFERNFKFNTSKLDQRDKPPFVLFEVRYYSPEGAKELAAALIDAWLAANKPKGASKSDLERKLTQSKEAELGTVYLISQLDIESKKIVEPSVRSVLNDVRVKLLIKRDDLRYLIENMERKLQGPARELVIVEPSLPKEPEDNNAGVYAVLAMISSFFIILLGLVINRFFVGDSCLYKKVEAFK